MSRRASREAIARRAQAAHGTFPERGPERNSLPYVVRSAGRCSEGSYDVIDTAPVAILTAIFSRVEWNVMQSPSRAAPR
ncbi:hypothetical protein EVAR_92291_1 [Eumeta japonica]|uniref:Uncharacterized protein n=1 Tax=Eumeta variegata TaxID=151549 RepID=A0A4C1TNB3_EUMVA|nr:hypothetical protein EVAR_92291_1 [Eumeta japonica]